MRGPLMLAAIVAGLLGATTTGDRSRPETPRPAKAVSGNKARLLERYQRRQARIAKRSADPR